MSKLPRHLNGSGLVRSYDRLDAEERFRLVMEAAARGDDRERDRLSQAAPMRAYKIADPTYMDRVDAAHDLSVALALDLGPRLMMLRLLRATPELVARSMAVGAEAAVASEEDLRELVEAAVSEPVGQAVESLAARVRSEAAAVAHAFAGVCRERMGLEPETVLRASLGPLYAERLALADLTSASPDKVHLAEWRELLERTWRKRTGT